MFVETQIADLFLLLTFHFSARLRYLEALSCYEHALLLPGADTSSIKEDIKLTKEKLSKAQPQSKSAKPVGVDSSLLGKENK